MCTVNDDIQTAVALSKSESAERPVQNSESAFVSDSAPLRHMLSDYIVPWLQPLTCTLHVCIGQLQELCRLSTINTSGTSRYSSHQLLSCHCTLAAANTCMCRQKRMHGLHNLSCCASVRCSVARTWTQVSCV